MWITPMNMRIVCVCVLFFLFRLQDCLNLLLTESALAVQHCPRIEKLLLAMVMPLLKSLPSSVRCQVSV